MEVIRSYAGLHDILAAEEDIRQCVEQFPHMAICHAFNFELELTKGNTLRAREALDHFLLEGELDGGQPAELYAQARLLQRKGECDEASVLLLRVCALSGADEACTPVPCGSVSPPPW
jgi:hypothetical protein